MIKHRQQNCCCNLQVSVDFDAISTYYADVPIKKATETAPVRSFVVEMH